MRLPNDIDKRADSFLGLTRQNKARIIEDLQQTSEDAKAATISEILKKGGNEARFLKHVLDKSDLPGPDDSPSNKRIGAPQTK